MTALQLLSVLNGALPVAYMAALLGYLAVFFREDSALASVVTPFAWVLVVVHGVYLFMSGVVYEHVPIASLWESLTFVAFAVTLVYLVLEWRLQVKSTGVFLLAGAVVFQTLSSSFVRHTREVPDLLRSPMFGLHVTAALLGYVALTVSAIYGIMYLLQYRQLKQRHVGLLFQRLPNLETLSRLNIGALGLGWIGLTLAILAGTMWAVTLDLGGQLEGNFVADPKFLMTVGLWVVYSVCLGGAVFMRWANRTLATASVLAFVLMLASSLSVSLLFRSFHDFS